MGTLNIPAGATVYLDTPIFIYSVEHHPIYGGLLQPLWQQLHVGAIQVISSELTLLEALVLPLRNRDSALVADYKRALLSTQVQLRPLTQEVLFAAADLRAQMPTLRTPDALHCVTARQAGCSTFLTNDRRLRAVAGFSVIVLDDVLNA